MGTGEHIPGSIFGLDDQPSRHTGGEPAAHSNFGASPASAAPAPWPPPQYVYVQGPPPSTVTPTEALSRPLMYLLTAILLPISMVNLYLAIAGRVRSKEALSKQSDAINVLILLR